MPKVRLDILLVEQGLAESRAKAQALIMAGQVRVAGQVVLKPATVRKNGSRRNNCLSKIRPKKMKPFFGHCRRRMVLMRAESMG